jgi:predicted HAD superfamily Cof-like phosphohydrolase
MSFEQYNLVREFHTVFGHPIKEDRAPEVFEDKKLISFRIALIEEEIKETEEAEEEGNITEVLDGLCDTQYVLLGMMIVLGVQPMEMHLLNTISLRDALGLLKASTSLNECVIAMRRLQRSIDDKIHSFGFDGIFDEAFQEVHRSNMTKVCASEEQARNDCDAKEAEGIPCYYEHIGDYWVLKNKETSKVVKASTWRVPNFSDLLNL